MKCKACNNNIKFQERYVLAEGYPIVSSETGVFKGMTNQDVDSVCFEKIIYAPKELSNRTPKYRLVLERI